MLVGSFPQVERPEVVAAGPNAAAGADQARGMPVEALAPVSLRPEQGTVIGQHEFVDEHVALFGELRPQVSNAVVEALLVIDVEEHEDHWFGVVRQGVGKPALPECAAVDRAERANIPLDELRALRPTDRSPPASRTGPPASAAAGPRTSRRRSAVALQVTCERKVRSRPAHVAPHRPLPPRPRRDLEQLHRHRRWAL